MDQPLDISKLVRQIYAPPHKHSGWRFEDLLGHANARYFRLGRHALYHALKGLGVGKDDIVLVPAFICKELVSAVHALGAKPAYYPVNPRLELGAPDNSLPLAKAIVAVNFFGFPQDLAPFRRYCESTGAFLIEDNAHGLFGKDAEGHALGTRGDIGIFSARKSLDVAGGGVIAVNRPALAQCFDFATEFAEPSASAAGKVKAVLRASVPHIGIGLVRLFIRMSRFSRRLRTGRAIPVSPAESEFELPQDDRAPKGLVEQLANIDVEEEILRRRNLYQWLDDALRPLGVRPVFENLPGQVVPYCYPMRLDEEQLPVVKDWLMAYGMECFPWPDLPSELGSSAPAWYRQIWGVQFLW